MNIRYFLEAHNISDDHAIEDYEVTEETFLSNRGSIQYDRHSVFRNGVDQVCLTKIDTDLMSDDFEAIS